MERRPGLTQARVRRVGTSSENTLTFTGALSRTGDTITDVLTFSGALSRTANNVTDVLTFSGGLSRTANNVTDVLTFSGGLSRTVNDVTDVLTFGSGLTRTVNAVANNLITGKAGGQTVVGGTGIADNLILQSTSNAQRGSVVCVDALGVGRVPGTLGSSPQFAVAGNVAITSSANATVDYVVVNSPTVTITGGTAITTATGCNLVEIEAPAYVSAVNIGAGGNTPAAATLAIKGPPTISGGGAFLGFGATTLWVQGNAQIDGQLTIGTGFQLRAVSGPVTIGPGGLDLQSLSATLRMGGNVALGGGAGATLGTIGGAGPAAAAQNGWLPITVAGTVSWFPFWR